MDKFPLVIVANRLPVSVNRENGKLVYKPSAGGLASALSAISRGTQKHIWVGWPGISAEKLTDAEKTQVKKELRTRNCLPLFLKEEEVQLFYDGYANATLWPLLHLFQTYAQWDDQYWDAYKHVNEMYAQTVARIAEPNARIWIHDYHFMLVPNLLRQQLPSAAIGFFLHIPFTPYEIFRLLPERKEILEGLLGADLIGFHTYDYANYFLRSVKRTLGLRVKTGAIMLDKRTVVVDAFPIGIDYEKFATATSLPKVKQASAALEAPFKGKKLILSVDRLDYTKGIPERLIAFETLLSIHPEYHRKLCLSVIAVPSRVEVPAYRKHRRAIEEIISRINGTYGTADWIPVSYQYKNLPFEDLVALYARADIALVTPLRDGMNMIAKEYVATKQTSSGVLILSELAGAADELQEAVTINPYDAHAFVEAIESALTMPKREQRERLHAMQQRLAYFTVYRWADDFMEQLDHVKRLNHLQEKQTMSQDMTSAIVTAYGRSKWRMLFLDYDGTLKSFVNSPEPALASPPKTLLDILRKLAESPHTSVCIVSGRTRDALDGWFKDIPVTLVAEHGAWIRKSADWEQGFDVATNFKSIIKPLLNHYSERTPGAIVEEKYVSLVWHYRNVSPELAYARNQSLDYELHTALAGTNIGIFNGNKIIEIKPYDAQKGTIIQKILGPDTAADFILCAGDDYTDEDMFTAVPARAYTIKVGPGETHARYHIASVEQMLKLLSALANKQ